MFQHAFVIIWGLSFALMLSAFFLSLTLWHREKKRVLGFFSTFILTLEFSTLNIFLIFYLNINIGIGAYPDWLFEFLFGGIIHSINLVLFPYLVYSFFEIPVPKNEKRFYFSLAFISLLKAIPVFWFADYKPWMKIIGDIFSFGIFIRLTIFFIKQHSILKGEKKKIAYLGLYALWGLFLLGLIKHSVHKSLEITNFFPFLIWGLQAFIIFIAILVIFYSIKHLLHREDQKTIHSMVHQELTNREMEIVRLVLDGLSNKDIAKKVYISENTVKKHLQNIYQKLGINSKLQLFSMMSE